MDANQKSHRLVGIALISGLVSSLIVTTVAGPTRIAQSLTNGGRNLANVELAMSLIQVTGIPSASLLAETSTITAGQPVVLDADCENVNSGSIDNGVGSVTVNNGWDYKTVYPSQTTTYTLTCSYFVQTMCWTSGENGFYNYQCPGTASVTSQATVLVNPSSQPDLIVIPYPPKPFTVASGATVSLEANIFNQGGSTKTPFTTYYWVDNDSQHDANVSTWGTQSAPIVTNGIDAQQSVRIAPQFTAPYFGQDTTIYYQYCTDWNGTVAESDETNNCSGWIPITVTGPQVTSCTPSVANAAPNKEVTWTVTTSGFSPALAHWYSWFVQGGNPSQGNQPTFTAKFSSAGNYAPTFTMGPISPNNPNGVGPVACTPVTITGTPNSCGGSPTGTLTVTPGRFVSGASTRVDYSATGIPANTTCSISGRDIGGPGINTLTTTPADASTCTVSAGSVTIPNVTTQSTYTISCGAAGTLKQAIANVLPHFKEF